MTNIVPMPRHASHPPPVPLLVEIGERLALTREAVGLTQHQFAQAYGCSRSALANWETGRGLPDTYTMIRFCTDREIPLDWIFAGKPQRLPHEIAERVLPRNPTEARRITG